MQRYRYMPSNFWMGFASRSESIEGLLKSEDCSVDKLLDDGDCLQEFKDRNETLIQYFDHDKLQVLIDYITVVADEKDGASRGRKYPFLVDQIFSCEIEEMLSKFFEAPPVKVEEIQVTVKTAEEDGEVCVLDEDDEDQAQNSEEPKDQTETQTQDNLESIEKQDKPVETEDNETEVKDSGYDHVLLDRLFKFLQTEANEEVNSVLSSYFCKLVTILLRRYPNELAKYIFAPESKVIDGMLRHVYQKSISELLLWVILRVSQNLDSETLASIITAQKLTISKLIDALGPDFSEEHNLNACSILQEMVKIKEFNDMICQQESLTKMVDHATADFDKGTKMSKVCSLNALNTVVSNLTVLQRSRSSIHDKYDSFEEDFVNQTNSDGEETPVKANSPKSQIDTLVEILKTRIPNIQEILSLSHDGAKRTLQVSDTEFVPLGQQRLHTVELVSNLVRLQREPIHNALMDSTVFINIIELTKAFPWNNMLQIRVMGLFERVINGSEANNDTFKSFILEQTQITKSLAEMGQKCNFEMDSGRQIRNGYMGLVVKISNLLLLKGESESVDQDTGSNDENQETSSDKSQKSVSEFLAKKENTPEWQVFVEGELKRTNELNNRTLGGQKRSPAAEDDSDEEEADEVDKTAKFISFSQMIKSFNYSASNDDDDEKEEENETDDKEDKSTEQNTDIELRQDDDDDQDEEESKSDDGLALSFETLVGKEASEPVKIQTPTIPQLNNEFLDNTYWRIDEPKAQEVDIDALLAELEA